MDKCIAYAVLQSDSLEEVLSKIQTTKSEALEIAIKTREQSLSSEWSAIRSHRVTASKCGEILKLMVKGLNLEEKALKVFTQTCDSETLQKENARHRSCPPAIKWGLEKELVARQLYLKHAPHFICIEYGIFLSKSGILGASPDGILFRSHGDLRKRCFSNAELLEIKCPYSKGD